MTIVESLKTIGGLPSISHRNRWLFWAGKHGVEDEENIWIVRQKRRHNTTTLIITESEEEAVEVLLKGKKDE